MIVSIRIYKLGSKHGVGVFVDLLRRFEVNRVTPIVVEFAFFGRILAAYLRSSFVNPATMIVLQVFASCVYEQIPGVFIDKHAGPIVQQIPADVVKVFAADRFFDR